jgi:endoglucanase
MIDVKLLKEICEVPGAPGFENRIRKTIISKIEGLVDEFYIDPMGSIVAIKKGKDCTKKVAVAAHMDEISFIVTHIDDEGFIRFHTLGGFDPKTLTAQRVIIHGDKDIIGVMGTKPIHVMSPEERNKAPQTKEFFIDTGLTGDEVKALIPIGSPITRERELIEMGNCVNSKSLDNRVSVFILIETLKALKGKEIPYDLCAIFTVQEEVGLRGATAVASGLNADFSVALDVTLAYDLPGAAPHEVVTRVNKGAAIKVLDGMTICDQRMVKFMKNLAIENEIPYQMEILPAGGTDTAGLQRYANGGSIAGAISIPTRYLHQVIEMAHKNDIKYCTDLLILCIQKIDKHDWSWS